MSLDNLNIHTCLGIAPPPKPISVICLTRGSSGYLTFNLYDKVYTFDDIAQLTVLFRQENYIKEFKMIEYTDLLDRRKWKFDPHFGYEEGPGYAYVTFLLTSEETADFRATIPGEFVEYEIVVDLDTDRIMQQALDSTIIEKQRPIIVKESIYGDVVGREN